MDLYAITHSPTRRPEDIPRARRVNSEVLASPWEIGRSRGRLDSDDGTREPLCVKFYEMI